MITALASRLFDRGVIVEEVDPLPVDAPLLPEEARAVATAGSKRRREFAAGRHCARRALARLGIRDFAVVAGTDRAPRWPEGVVGSISHTYRYCVAAVAPRASYISLGVDAEPDEPLEEDLWAAICTAPELRWLEAQPATQRGRLARLIFSAKECAYKTQYPLTGAFLDFHDVQLSIDPMRGQFSATVSLAAGTELLGGTCIDGRFASGNGTLVTAAELRRR